MTTSNRFNAILRLSLISTLTICALLPGIKVPVRHSKTNAQVLPCSTLEQQQKVVADDGVASDRFGASVAVSGDTMVVGAPLEDSGATNQGAAYIYVFDGMNWILQQKLTAPDAAVGDQFGSSVAIDGDTLVVGAPLDNGVGGADQGAAYVYMRSGTTWTLQEKLTASDGAADDQFGESVAISGDTVVAGARFADIGGNANQGAAYVFTRSGTDWSQQEKLTSSDGAAGDQFGSSVAIDGHTAAVGARLADIGANVNQGAGYVFTRSGTDWSEQDKLIASDGAGDDRLGDSIAISGDTVVAGADGDTITAGVVVNLEQGSAYVFTRSGTDWNQQAKLTASDGGEGDTFGSSVAIDGDKVVVGSDLANVGGNANQGAAYVYERGGTTWTEQQKLTASDGAAGDEFGTSVAISEDKVVAGAHLADVGGNADRGAAYVFSCPCPAIALSPVALRNATVGASYSQIVTASGGVAPHQFSVSAGSLPPGLTLAPGGTLSGAPTAAGAFSFTIQATDANGCVGERAYTLVVVCPTITLIPNALSDGSVGSPYSQTVTAAGGVAPHQFSISSGSLPPGLTLTAGGVISGVPTAVGAYSFTVTATDANLCQGSLNYTIVVTMPNAAIIVSPTNPILSEGEVGEPYMQEFTASGTTPFSFTIIDGFPPAGLTLESDGTLSGSPTASGTYSFTIAATDSNFFRNRRNYSLVIKPSGKSNNTARNVALAGVAGGVAALIISEAAKPRCATITVNPSTQPTCVVGQPCSQAFTTSGGTAPHGFTIIGSPPPGLTLDSGGTLSGSPTAAGTFTFSVAATDSKNCRGERAYTLVIKSSSLAIFINPENLPAGTAGRAYNQPLTVSGGATPFGFSITSGSLPAGLTLTATGLINGTPSAAGTSNFTAVVTDRNGRTATRDYAIRVNPHCSTVTLTPASFPDGEAGQTYSQILGAGGGTGPFTFNLLAGALPLGLLLDLTTGSIIGKPSQVASYDFTISATDSNGCAGAIAYKLSIAPRMFRTVSAASDTPLAAPKEIVAGFGSGLADSTVSASSPPLPASLDGMRVTVRDSAGVERAAPLLMVSPTMISYQIPEGAAPGAAAVSVFRGTELVAAGTAQIAGPRPPSSPKTRTGRRRQRAP